jgi:HTH-type transcriptional regulator, transcriptional repressor of NAD biosynthesis genes
MVKRYKHGLVLGKFMPPTNGHLFLIDSAIQKCEKVYVMICSIESEPISGKLRYSWLKQIYDGEPAVEVIWCDDPNPSYPHECESPEVFYEKYWVPSVYNRILELDVVFTSELYGDEFARYLGIHHELVDINRISVPVSGTAVREDPFGNWEHIPFEVKPYFIKKVAILGPESVGKTVLSKRLAEHFACPWVMEYGREYSQHKGDEKWVEQDFEMIAAIQQLFIEQMCEVVGDQYADSHQNLLVVDTEVLTTQVWAEVYLGKPVQSIVFDHVEKIQQFDLYIILDCDVPWINDGTRLYPNHREWYIAKLKEMLEQRGIEYTVISGSYDERFDKAVKLIQDM